MSRLKSSRNRFRPGLFPGLRWGSLRCSSRPAGEGIPFPFLTPRCLGVLLLSASDALISAPVHSRWMFGCAANESVLWHCWLCAVLLASWNTVVH